MNSFSKCLKYSCFLVLWQVLRCSDFLFLKRSLSFSASVFCLFYPAYEHLQTSSQYFASFLCKHTNRRDPKLKQFSLWVWFRLTIKKVFFFPLWVPLVATSSVACGCLRRTGEWKWATDELVSWSSLHLTVWVKLKSGNFRLMLNYVAFLQRTWNKCSLSQVGRSALWPHRLQVPGLNPGWVSVLSCAHVALSSLLSWTWVQMSVTLTG